MDAYIKEELARAAADFSWPGFRKGKVPEQIVREHTNEMAILDAAADEALHDVIPEIAADEKLSVLGRPQLTITKMAPQNPVGFKVRFALSPPSSCRIIKKLLVRLRRAKAAQRSAIRTLMRRLSGYKR